MALTDHQTSPKMWGGLGIGGNPMAAQVSNNHTHICCLCLSQRVATVHDAARTTELVRILTRMLVLTELLTARYFQQLMMQQQQAQVAAQQQLIQGGRAQFSVW